MNPNKMTKIPFKVSARTAKLIGQENFSNAEGAIIELVKNCYDADAKNCIVIFDIPYTEVPNSISKSIFETLDANFQSAYKLVANTFSLKVDLDIKQLKLLKEFFLNQNSIYIIDNGDGMTEDVIENQWMLIGTGNKELDFESEDGRIKTGAKGIGRFALDRLGTISEMWTLAKNDVIGQGYYWKMDWRQFDKANQSISDIEADLEENSIDIKGELLKRFKNYPEVVNVIDNTKTKFNSGTIIRISNLKDSWLNENLNNVFKSLEALIPPKELSVPFSVSFFNLQNIKNYGDVETAFYNDYDYKILADFNSKDLTVKLSITRNELDLSIIKKEHQNLFTKSKPPYDIDTLEKKQFSITVSINELLKWEKNEINESKLKNVGDFTFSFYYIKVLGSQKENYPFLKINSSERKNLLNKFGGIKIYRDSFRVRPYGDVGNDWLKLGERSSSSPAGAGQRVGDWRVRPNQTAGLINISRVKNSDLVDKSDRGALVENETFVSFQKIIIGIIRYFEIDRSKLLHVFYLENKKNEEIARQAEIHRQAEILADKIVKERLKIEEKTAGSQINLFRGENTKDEEKESYKKLVEETLQKFTKAENDDNAEIAQVRTLASLGLVVSSFAHELKHVKNTIGDIADLEKIYLALVPDKLKEKIEFKDGINILKSLKIDSEKIIHWVDYSLTAIKKDKRKRSNLDFENYFKTLSLEWKKVLKNRNIEFIIEKGHLDSYVFRAFEMDMNTIFSNLITNSIDSFLNVRELRKRKINIHFASDGNFVTVTYSDTGTGLPKVFENDKDEIFLPFTTSKKDRDGNDIGTGLGMYLIKNVITDYNGKIQILPSDFGFKIKIDFPTRKTEENEI